MSSASLGFECQERLIGAKNVCSSSSTFRLVHGAKEKKPALTEGCLRLKSFLLAGAAIDFYQREDRCDDTVVCQWRMLIYLDSLWFNLSLAFSKRKARNSGRSCRRRRLSTMLLWVVVRKIINYLKVEPVINGLLSHPEARSQNKSVCQLWVICFFSSFFFFRKYWVRVSRWHVFSSHM